MRPLHPIQKSLVWLALNFLFWGALTTIFASQFYFSDSLSFREAMRISGRDWLGWALLAPLIVWLAMRFPLERQRWKISLPVHLGVSIIVVIFCEWLTVLISPLPNRPPQLPGPPPFAEDQPRPGLGPPPNDSTEPPPDRPRWRQGQSGRPFGPRRLRRRGADLPPAVRLKNRILMRAKFDLPIYWVLVSVTHALTYYRRYRDRERTALQLKAQLAQARIQALQMQLQPHFLFNTLNAIATLVHKDADAADEMIVNLSELLRFTLDHSEQQEVPLRQEIDFLQRYLAIQQTRFGDRLNIAWEIEPSLLDVPVPNLILQPLVENAIRHGIEPQAGPGQVTIRAVRRNGHLELTVQDNGPGATTPVSKPIREGIGLANTRARLQELYGDAHRLTAQADPEGGYSVVVQIPLRQTIPPAPSVLTS